MKISVILANFNHKNYLENAVESVRSQDYVNWEIILVDDKSTDNSACLIKKLAEQDLRVKAYYLEKNIGSNKASKYAAEMSSGDLILGLGADDRLASSNYFSDAVNALCSNTDAVGFYGVTELVDAQTAKSLGSFMGSAFGRDGFIESSIFIKGFLSNKLFVPGSSVIWRRSVFIDSDIYREDLGPFADYYINHILSYRSGIIFKNKIYSYFSVWKSKSNFGNKTNLIDKIKIFYKIKKEISRIYFSNKLNFLLEIWYVKKILYFLFMYLNNAIWRFKKLFSKVNG